MDYVYATIIVAMIFAAVVKFASWKREHKRLNGIITDARDRCEIKRGEQMEPLPDFGRRDMQSMYRHLIKNSRPLDPEAAEVLQRNMWELM